LGRPISQMSKLKIIRRVKSTIMTIERVISFILPTCLCLVIKFKMNIGCLLRTEFLLFDFALMTVFVPSFSVY
jgi:hypothetical protein